MNRNNFIILSVFILSFLIGHLLIDSYGQINNAFTRTANTIANQQNQRDLLDEMYIASQERTIILLNMTGESDPFVLDELNQELSTHAQHFITARSKFIKMDHGPRVLQMIKELSKAARLNQTVQNKVSRLIREDEFIEAKAILFSQSLPLQNVVIEQLQALIDSESSMISTTLDDLVVDIDDSSQNLISLGIIMLGSSFIIIFVVLKRSSKKEYDLLQKTLKAKTHSDRLLKRLNDQRFAIDQHAIVTTTDTKGTITYVNDKFCTLSGYTKEELIGKNHRIINSGNQPKAYWKSMFETVANGKVWHDEVKNIRKDGQFYWVDTTIVPVNWDTSPIPEDGENTPEYITHDKSKILGYISIRTDITSTKEQEEKLLAAKISAESAAIAKSQFLATMSHEIRTPMNGVIGMTQLLEETDLNDEQQDYLQTINESGNNLLNIINDILDFSKLDANMLVLEEIEYDLERLSLDCLKLVSANALSKEIEFIFDYEPDCPKLFIGDPSKMRQVLINLLGNAVKFTQSGFIRLGVSSQKEYCRIEIQDTGVGLKPEAINTLFDEFTQADNSTTRQFGGTGLGLAISKKIVMLMGASIGVDSQLNQGTTFWLEGNLNPVKELLPETDSSLENVSAMFYQMSAETENVFRRLFKHMGLKVQFEQTEQGINNALAKTQFDVVVIDSESHADAGFELAQQLRQTKRFNSVKILLLTTTGYKVDLFLLESMSINAYMNKQSQYQTFFAMFSLLLSQEVGQPILSPNQLSNNETELKQTRDHFNARVLLAEDVLPNQLVATKFLTQMGVEVDVVSNGDEAIKAVQKSHYDLIFMDCRMPVKDGYEASQEIRRLDADKRDIPIIALTANASVEDQALCKKAGMNGVIIKPYKKHQLAKSLNKWLDQKDVEIPEVSVDSMDDDHVVNEKIFMQLKEDMGGDLDEILDSSFVSIQNNINNLLTESSQTTTEEKIRWAHSIKSPAAFLGASRLKNQAKYIESTLLLDEDMNIIKLTEILQSHFNEAKNVILSLK